MPENIGFWSQKGIDCPGGFSASEMYSGSSPKKVLEKGVFEAILASLRAGGLGRAFFPLTISTFYERGKHLSKVSCLDNSTSTFWFGQQICRGESGQQEPLFP